jgi:hypothetical protein
MILCIEYYTVVNGFSSPSPPPLPTHAPHHLLTSLFYPEKKFVVVVVFKLNCMLAGVCMHA